MRGTAKSDSSDFFYAGAAPDQIRAGVALGEIYLWVENFPNHNGMHVCAMGDGRVTAENLLKTER